MDLGKLGVWYFTDTKSSADAAAFAKNIKSMGYSALWLPETIASHVAPLIRRSSKNVAA